MMCGATKIDAHSFRYLGASKSKKVKAEYGDEGS